MLFANAGTAAARSRSGDDLAGTGGPRRMTTGASSTSPPTSNPLLWLRWNGCGRWSARLGRSFRTCSLTSLASTGANGSGLRKVVADGLKKG